MKVIFILSTIFWEHLVITNCNIQEKNAMMMDMSYGCFGVNCTSSRADINRNSTKEYQTQTKLLEQHPLISTGRSENPKINVVNRSGLDEELETADYNKNPRESIKARHKRRVSHKKCVSHKRPVCHKKCVSHNRPVCHQKCVSHKRPVCHKKCVSHKRPCLHKKHASHKRRNAYDIYYRMKTARLVAIQAMTMTIESTKLMKESLNGSVEHLNSLFREACNSIKLESENTLKTLKIFANDTDTNIRDNMRNGRLLEAQSLAANNLAEANKLSFINTVNLSSIYFPSVDSIINLIESNAIKLLKTTISLNNKMVKLETTNEGLRSFIDTQTQKVSNVARRCAIDFTEIGQLGISKLKVYSENTDRLFAELADTYGQKFTVMGEQCYGDEVQLLDSSNKVIRQIEKLNKETNDDIFAITSEKIDLLIREFYNDIKEITTNKFKLQ